MSGDRRRRFLRLPIESRVFVELEAAAPGSLGPGNVARCETLEVSEGGLRVRLCESVSVGAILQVGVELPGKDEPFYLVAADRQLTSVPSTVYHRAPTPRRRALQGDGTDSSSHTRQSQGRRRR